VGRVYTPTTAPVLDLSEGGALLEVPCILRSTTIYGVRLALGRDEALLRATVLRSYADHLEELPGEMRARYHAALHFIDTSARERELLRLVIGAREAVSVRPHVTPPSERREWGRSDLDGTLEVEVGLRLAASVLMLSHGGMLVQLPFAPSIGIVVNCSFAIDEQPLQLDAIVRHTHREGVDEVNPPHRVGLEFLGRTGPARTAIEAYVDRRLKATAGPSRERDS